MLMTLKITKRVTMVLKIEQKIENLKLRVKMEKENVV